MGFVILLNDVENSLDSEHLIPDNFTPVSPHGERQSVSIASYLSKKTKELDLIAASDSPRLSKLIHNIRINLKGPGSTTVNLRQAKALRERDFGVLSGSRFSIDSDIFKHTRICAEKGESVAVCRERAMSYFNGICRGHLRILVISHPFVCQIISNVLLSTTHTTLTSFWFKKGSFIKIKSKEGKFGIDWEFESGHNALCDTQYSIKEIYSDLLGEEGTSANKGT
jgi:broad specificity phosphatase PhoE